MADVAAIVARVRQAKLALDSLTIYRSLRSDPVIAGLYNLLALAAQDDPELASFLDSYASLSALLWESETASLSDHIAAAAIFADNAFSRAAAGGQANLDQLLPAAAHDLACLQLAAGVAAADLKALAASQACRSEAEAALVAGLPGWPGPGPAPAGNDPLLSGLMAYLGSGRPWAGGVQMLAGWHRQRGCGLFARYRAFIWERLNGCGLLRGVAQPDPVTLADLIGYELEREEVIANTRQFLAGFAANNVLLYGDRGTGKSSTVKALLNEFGDQGLRLVEVAKDALHDFPLIIRQLKDRPQRFIIFVDDLSFADSEENYVALKAVLEGSLETRPANVVIYATSNRRHLVHERAGSDEVRAGDTEQEQLSLADRFGITVVFSAPDHERYLAIVEGIAAKRGLQINADHLRREAIRWEKWYNGRSPRSARQLIDWLEGQAGL